MKKRKQRVPASSIKSIFNYNKSTGRFTRLKGHPVGLRIKRNGYEVLCIKYRDYLAHHLVWAWHYGRWPKRGKVIDHIDRNRLNNRISNLREVTQKENQAVLCKPIVGKDKSGKSVEFPSIAEAAKHFKCWPQNIQNCLSGGNRRTACGYRWEYI